MNRHLGLMPLDRARRIAAAGNLEIRNWPSIGPRRALQAPDGPLPWTGQIRVGVVVCANSWLRWRRSFFDLIWDTEPGGNVAHIAEHDRAPEDVEWALHDPEVLANYTGEFVVPVDRRIVVHGEDIEAVLGEAARVTGRDPERLPVCGIDDPLLDLLP
jgi:hypothetical protein